MIECAGCRKKIRPNKKRSKRVTVYRAGSVIFYYCKSCWKEKQVPT